MINTTDNGENKIENGEQKNAEDARFTAFDQAGNPNKGDAEGSDGKNAVKNDGCHIGTNQREYEKEIAKRHQNAEGKRRPNKGHIDRRRLQNCGGNGKRKHGKHEIRAHMTDKGFQSGNKFFHNFHQFFLS